MKQVISKVFINSKIQSLKTSISKMKKFQRIDVERGDGRKTFAYINYFKQSVSRQSGKGSPSYEEFNAGNSRYGLVESLFLNFVKYVLMKVLKIVRYSFLLDFQIKYSR